MGPISAEISPYRRWWIVAALAAVCVSIIVYLIHTLSHPMAAHIVAPPPPGASALSQAPAVTPAAAGPAMMDSSSDRPGAPGTTQDASTQPRTAVQPASPAPGTVSTGETVQESALEEVIASNLKSEGFPCSLLSLLQDFRPSSPNAILTVALTQPVSGPVARDTIVQALGAAADAASAARLDRVTVRIVGSIGTAPPALLLIGDANTETFKNVNPSTLTAANSASSIQNSWWNAGIPQN
jgi:hypothetical protein